ncbi:unnamed protein product [Rhizophagus irregularis]|nr:unnamed protein product [Rhizophagus irregularis]
MMEQYNSKFPIDSSIFVIIILSVISGSSVIGSKTDKLTRVRGITFFISEFILCQASDTAPSRGMFGSIRAKDRYASLEI